MHINNSLRLTFLPALAVLPGYQIELSEDIHGEIKNVYQPEGKTGDVIIELLGGQQKKLSSRSPIKLLKPLIVTAETGNMGKEKLLLLQVLENANCAGGLLIDENANVRFAVNDDSDDDWPDLANTVESIYEYLLECDTLYATLVVNEDE